MDPVGGLVGVPAGGGAEARLRAACKDFEAIFLNEMMKAMRATVPEGGLLPRKLSQQIFEGMFDEEVARRASGGFGMAELLYEELARALPQEGAKAAVPPGRSDEGVGTPPEEVP